MSEYHKDGLVTVHRESLVRRGTIASLTLAPSVVMHTRDSVSRDHNNNSRLQGLASQDSPFNYSIAEPTNSPTQGQT